MSRLKQLIHEIHRRSLWQVLGIYLVGSWFVLQVVDTMVGALKLPDWAPPLALILLIIGLPCRSDIPSCVPAIGDNHSLRKLLSIKAYIPTMDVRAR